MIVAHVVKSFDTVDRSIVDCVLSKLGQLGWFRHVYFACHANARLRFNLAACTGEAWTRDGGTPQGYPEHQVHCLLCIHLGETACSPRVSLNLIFVRTN